MEELSLDVNMPVAELEAIKFSHMTSSDMEKLSSASIIELCDATNAKLGLPNGEPQCATCGSRSVRDCDGNFGVIKLAATVHNPYLIEEAVQLLNQICPGCLTLKQNGDAKRDDGTSIQATCKYCSKDGAKLYPSIIFKMLTSPRVTLSRSKLHRNTSVMDKISIIAEVAGKVTHKSKNKAPHETLPQDFWDFIPDDNQPPQSNVTKKILSPYQVFHMLKKLDPELIKQIIPRRELLFLSCLPVTSNCHRVAEMPYGHSDGPLRSSFGQQIVQFSYDTADDMYSDHDFEGEPGDPVGSWAACSISEAAYGALDHPVNGLEDSPLMNLQEVLKCHKGTNSLDHTGLLFLSKHLRKSRYGLEYASLQVKDHLERVDFSDLVDTVMILYGGSDMEKTEGNPWITHFHLSQETMKIKRLGQKFIVGELVNQYNALREQLNNALPSVCVSNSTCSIRNECIKNQTRCITMVVQVESNSTSQLDLIKERVIPSILATKLKGFLEFKNVKVQCHQDNELAVKVGMSEHCKSGKFWATLQNALFPIMELIDWERSRPEKSLRSTTDAIGKNIRQQHLLVVADCLSVSGQFHGLSSQGLKQQRTWLSISSPFSEACFSRPAHCFINAAKQDCGQSVWYSGCNCLGQRTLYWDVRSIQDSIFWEGSHETKQNKNVYDFLRNPEIQAFEKNAMATYRKRTEKNTKQRSALNSEGNVDQKFLDAKVGIWENIIDMRTCLQNMLREYTLNAVVTEQDKSCLVEALKFHPRWNDKIGAGIREIKIGVNPSHLNSRCFIVLRNDDTTADFSYKKCVLGAANSVSPELGSYIEKILSNRAIRAQGLYRITGSRLECVSTQLNSLELQMVGLSLSGALPLGVSYLRFCSTYSYSKPFNLLAKG
uniref:DNA-directed RNA polymerase n=1 Tax=Leersia perrieri TaxID=77586 RepID=A0A0D9W8E5_9ORYZ